MNRVLILGGDGYCGWAASLYLSRLGYEIAILDNLVRRQWDRQLNIDTLTPIGSLHQRINAWRELTGHQITAFIADMSDYPLLASCLRVFRPSAIVHFAEQRDVKRPADQTH